jgi:hypothetical protein
VDPDTGVDAFEKKKSLHMPGFEPRLLVTPHTDCAVSLLVMLNDLTIIKVIRNNGCIILSIRSCFLPALVTDRVERMS